MLRKHTRWADVPEGLRCATHWRRRGRQLKPNAQPAAIMYGWYGHSYCLYPESETMERIPRAEHPPQVVDLLVALLTLTRTAKRYRDAAQTHYRRAAHGLAGFSRETKERCYDLKDRGLIHAVQSGRIVPVRFRGALTEYVGEGYCFHSYLRPIGIDGVASDDDAPLRVDAKRKGSGEARLKDAMATIQALPQISLECAGFEQLSPDEMCDDETIRTR